MPMTPEDLELLSDQEREDYQANAATMDSHIEAQLANPDAAAPAAAEEPEATAEEDAAAVAAALAAEAGKAAPAADPAADPAPAAAAAEAAPAAAAEAPADDPFADLREMERAQVPVSVNQADLQTRITRADAIPAEIVALATKYENGEIDQAQRDAAHVALLSEQSKLNREIARMEARGEVAQDMSTQAAANVFSLFAKQVKQAGGPDYAKPAANKMFQDSFPAVIEAANAAGETLSITELYARAHSETQRRVQAMNEEMGITTAAKPAVPKPAAAPAKGKAPMGAQPPALGAIPQAEHHQPPASAEANMLANLEGEDAEVAFQRMTPEARDRVLNGGWAA